MANLFIISAPSGCGKTSLVKELIEQNQNLAVSTSHTTRKPRPDEENGKNYFFISNFEFDEIRQKNGFLEFAEVFENNYGTAKKNVEDLLNDSQDVILEIDWQGARQVRQNFSEVISIFILPPTKNALKDRLTSRAQDDPETIKTRMSAAQTEMQHFTEYDYLIINDDFQTALTELTQIILSHRLKLPPQTLKHHPLINSLLPK